MRFSAIAGFCLSVSMSVTVLFSAAQANESQPLKPTDAFLQAAEKEQAQEAAYLKSIEKRKEEIENKRARILALSPERRDVVLKNMAETLAGIKSKLEAGNANQAGGPMRQSLLEEDRAKLLEDALEILSIIPEKTYDNTKALKQFAIAIGATGAIATVVYALGLYYPFLVEQIEVLDKLASHALREEHNTELYNELSDHLSNYETVKFSVGWLRPVLSLTTIATALGFGRAGLRNLLSERKNYLSAEWEAFWNTANALGLSAAKTHRRQRVKNLTDSLLALANPALSREVHARIATIETVAECSDLLTQKKPTTKEEIEALMEQEFAVEEEAAAVEAKTAR